MGGQEGSRGRCRASSRLADAPRRFARATGTAASPMLSDWGFRAASPVARDAGASPRHALLAENLNLEAWGKPSLWVITKDLWYQDMERLVPFWRRRVALMRSPVRPDVRGIGFNWSS